MEIDTTMNAPTSSPAAPRAPATTTTAIATTTSSAPSQTAPPPPVPAPPPPTPPSHRHRYHLHHGNPSSSTMNKSVTRDVPHDIHDMDHPNDNNTNNAIANRARRLRSRYLNSQNIRLSRSSSSSSTAAATNNMGPYLSAIASDPSPSPRHPHPSNISSFRHSGHPHSLYRHPTPPLPSSSTSLINSVNSPSQQQQQQLQLQLQLQRRASLRPTASFSSSSLSTAQHPMHPNHQRIQLSSSSSYSSATALQQQHRQQHRHRQRQQQSSRIDTNNNNNSMSNTSTTPYTSSSVHKFILDREIGIHQGSNKIMKKSRMNPIPTLNLPTMSPKLLSWIESEMIDRLDLGTYIELDKPSNHVRSTISIAFSHDGSLFASTHGDHTVKVFEYPSGKQITCLDGHPRTPWTVRFHPKNKFILASGCLGSDCRIWDLKLQKCIRKHTFRSSISCVSFNPNGDVLAVTSGKQLLLWDYLNDRRDGNRNPGDDWMDGQASGHALAQQRSSRHYSNSSSRSSSSSSNSNNAGLQHVGKPRDILTRSNPFHMVDFHPSGTMLMTGEKNRFPSSSAATTSNANANNNNNAATGAATANIPTNAGTTNTAVVTNTEVQTNGNNQNNNEPNQNIDNQNNTNQQQQQLHASANVPNNNNNNTNNHQNQNNNNNNTTQAALAAAAAAAEEQQFTLCLVIHRLDRRLQRTYTDPVLTVPRAVAYNDAGIHFSPCGTMLAACIPIDNSNHFRIAVLSLTNRDDGIKIGDVLYETRLDRGHVTALTNLKFSATGKHLLAGFSFRPTNPVLRAQIQIQINNSGEGNNTRRRPTAGGRRNNNIIRRRERNNSHSHHQLAHHHDIHQHFGGVQNIKKQVRVVDIYRLEGEGHLKRVKSLCADFDMQQTNNNNSNNSNNNNNHNNNNSDDNHANNNEETTNNSSPDNDNSNDNNQNNNTNWEGGVEDEINVAVFGGGGGVADGVVYGTQKGRIRMFQMKTGRVADLLEEGEDYTKRAELEDEDDCLDIDLEERGAINSVDEDIDIDEDIDSDDDIIGEDDDEEDDDEDDNEFSTMEVVSDVLGPAPSAHENFAAYRHRARPSNSE